MQGGPLQAAGFRGREIPLRHGGLKARLENRRHPGASEIMTAAKARKPLHIGFISTRFKGLDGVSLEAAKWSQILENFHHVCYWFAGELDKDPAVSHSVPEAHFKHPPLEALNNSLFGVQERSRETTNALYHQKEFLKDKLYAFLEAFSIDMIVAENVLSIPMHIPLGMALTELIAETGIPAIGHHHDLYWERPRFLLNSIQDILHMAFPPDLPSIRHVVINSVAQTDLAAKRGIASQLIYNVLDFSHREEPLDDFNIDFRREMGFSADDLLVLQPTRVVSRKGIEQALYLIEQLRLPEVKLLISHSPGDEGLEYFEWIRELARQQKLPVHFIFNRLQETRRVTSEGKKLFSLWDVYPHMNLITYPSLYEGFGNAFLEAIYYRKPLLVNRYSVYITDIEPKGFEVIAIDGYLTRQAVAKVREVLLDPDRRQAMVEKNFELGRKYFSFASLKRNLSGLLSSFFGTSPHLYLGSENHDNDNPGSGA
jgi:glycosyltransferase involved in cell wall biosynthesis